ncbi:zinc-alpha-2-glycoprotein isoform X9 [Lates calcarifer]|uniref:Zinc-alpha-2-glycoprotein isoform X9 n=1 Tax=Lates calcarifer TaxID=8187 RepID=A0AAJ8B3G2_LATCA|nr:zinc-alpha-2-glycoprotein isoform X9 [Lates calcarifer]
MKKLFLFILLCHIASSVEHSLKFFFTGSYGVKNFPEFVGVVMVGGVEVIYCDSNIRGAEPKQDWMRKLMKDDPEHMDWYSNECRTSHSIFNTTIKDLMQSFNQTGGVHIYQRMFGCEWDDETAEVNGYDQYGYDGEDFIEFDLKTETWITATPQAVTTKNKWDNDRAYNVQEKNYLTQVCPDQLKKYLNYGRTSLLRTDRPSVSLLQKTPSSPVSCHATGFYPDRAMMFWRKDGEELDEDVDRGEILPNHDGTFQMRADLNISSVSPEDWRRYDCVFQLSGVKEDIITKLDKAEIRTNWGKTGLRSDVPPSEFPAAAVIGVVVGLLLLLLCISGLFIWRRNNNGFRPANISDSTSETSQQPLTDHSRFFIMSATLCRYCVQSPTPPESNVLT